MAQVIGNSITDFQEMVFDRILGEEGIVKALVVYPDVDFLNATPTPKQYELINNPYQLIRKQVFPYTKAITKNDEIKPYITTLWTGFRKRGDHYISGTFCFHILIPETMENTTEGIRYNYIADRLDSILNKDFQFLERGDIERVPEGYIGHYIVFKTLDLHTKDW